MFGKCAMLPAAPGPALLLSAVLLLWPVDAVPVYSSLGDLSEISGDEVQDVRKQAPLTEAQRWHLMARELHRGVKTLRDEQFNRDFREVVNMTSFEGVRIHTPLLKPSDGCLSRNFSTERCLGRIHSVLTWYKEHLSYIETENLTLTLMNDVKHETKQLLEFINSQLQSRDTPAEIISSASLHGKSAWTRKTAVHSILFNFTSVMIDTCRAISYINKRKTAHSHQLKDRKKPSEWISDKN